MSETHMALICAVESIEIDDNLNIETIEKHDLEIFEIVNGDKYVGTEICSAYDDIEEIDSDIHLESIIEETHEKLKKLYPTVQRPGILMAII